MVTSEWIDAPSVPEPTEENSVLVFHFGDQKRWIRLQQKTYGDNRQPIHGDLQLLQKLVPTAEFLAMNDHWGPHNLKRNDWVAKTTDETIDLLLQWSRSPNATHRGYAVRFLSVFRNHSRRAEIEEFFLRKLQEDLAVELRLQEKQETYPPEERCAAAYDNSWLWEALPGVASEVSEAKLLEWMAAPLCPDHARQVTNAAIYVFGLPGRADDDVIAFCPVGETPERLQEIAAKQREKMQQRQQQILGQIRTLHVMPADERLTESLGQWEQLLPKDEEDWFNITGPAFECARRMSRFGDPVVNWAETKLKHAEALNERVMRAAVLMYLGQPFPRQIIDDLKNGSTVQQQSVQHIVQMAESYGVPIE